MNSQELIKALRKLKVETGSLACWGCGHEHNCGIHGCRVMREAADLIENQQNHIAALMQANDALRPRWIPVEERLPENGEKVLCWYEYFRYGEYNRMYQTYDIGYQFGGSWGGEVARGHRAKVLAWMPLPKPPKKEGR